MTPAYFTNPLIVLELIPKIYGSSLVFDNGNAKG